MSQDGFLAWISPQRIKPFLGRSPAPTCHPREGGDLPASKGGRGGCCSPLVTPDLIRGRLIEPCRSVSLERSDRVHGKSRHRVAVRRPLTQKQVWSVKCEVWDDYSTAAMSRRGSRGSISKKLGVLFNLDLVFDLDILIYYFK